MRLHFESYHDFQRNFREMKNEYAHFFSAIVISSEWKCVFFFFFVGILIDIQTFMLNNSSIGFAELESNDMDWLVWLFSKSIF